MITILITGLILASGVISDTPPRIQTSRTTAQVMPSVPQEDDMFTFVVYGDRTGGPAQGIAVLSQAVRDTNLIEPDLVMTVGDLVQGYNTRAQWLPQAAQFREVMGDLSCPWFPVAGNHDVYWRGAGRPPEEHEGDYEAWFGPLWYSFDHKGCRFIVLYTDEGDPETGQRSFGNPASQRMSEPQKKWLQQTLDEAKEKRHVFVFCHHPRWRGGNYGDDWESVHRMLADAGNVTAVFAGHVHQLKHDGWRDGIEYLSLATVGGHLPREVPAAGHMHHINLVTVRDDHIAQATLPVGSVIDPRALTADHIQAIDRLLAAGATIGMVLEVDGTGWINAQPVLTLRSDESWPVTWSVWPDSDDTRWSMAPDHLHERVEAGSETRIPLSVYHPGPLDASWTAPVVQAQAEVEIDGTAWTLPPQRIELAVRPGSLTKKDRAGILTLDGSTGSVRMPLSQDAIGSGPMTVEAWIAPNPIDGARGIVAKTEQSEFGLFIEDGKPSFWVYVGNGYAIARAADPIAMTQWHHVAGVHDGQTAALYINGDLVATVPAKGARRVNALPLMIGSEVDRNGHPVSSFNGTIDEVRVSSVDRYKGEGFTPAHTHARDDDTIVLLHLNGRQGPFVFNDASTVGHGRVVGSASFTATER